MSKELLRDVKELWKKSDNDLIFTQATALAYNTLLSLIPLFAAAFFLFKFFGGFDKLLDQIQPFIEDNLAPAFSDRISNYLDEIVNKIHAGAVGIFGLVGFIFTAITTISTVEKSFNLIWGIQKSRPLAKRVMIYGALTFIGPLFAAISLVIGFKAFLWLKSDHGALAQGLVSLLGVIPYISSGFLFSFMFFFIPNVRVHVRDAFIAGITTGVIFELAKSIYSLYAKRTISHDAIYGALIVIPVFLVWLYVVWLIVLFGAEFCCYLQFRRQGIKYRFNWVEHLTPFAIADIIETLAQAGDTSPEKNGLTTEELQRQLQMPFYELIAHLNFLESEGWVGAYAGKFSLLKKPAGADMTAISDHLDQHRYVPKGEASTKIYQKMKDLWKSISHEE